MVTIALYLITMVAVIIVIFIIVWWVFGRGEQLPPVEPGTTLAYLPRSGISGADVRKLKLALVFRGYKQSEVDWALEKLAGEIDELRAVNESLRLRGSGSEDAPGSLTDGAPDIRQPDKATTASARPSIIDDVE